MSAQEGTTAAAGGGTQEGASSQPMLLHACNNDDDDAATTPVVGAGGQHTDHAPRAEHPPAQLSDEQEGHLMQDCQHQPTAAADGAGNPVQDTTTTHAAQSQTDVEPAAAAAGAAPSTGKRGRPAKNTQAAARKKQCRAGEAACLDQEDHAGAAPAQPEGNHRQQAEQQTFQTALPGLSHPWPQLLIQQQQLMSFAAGFGSSEPATKQQKHPRPPKKGGQQLAKGEGCCFSLERPFGSLSAAIGHHSLVPPGFHHQQQLSAWLLQQQAQQQQHTHHQNVQGSRGPPDMPKGGQGQQAEPCAEGDAGLKTRLSVRSVAYLEELLQQTAQATGPSSSPAAGNLQSVMQARSAAYKGTAVTSRLSVGNMLISPPMSRAASTCITLLPACVDTGGLASPGKGHASQATERPTPDERWLQGGGGSRPGSATMAELSATVPGKETALLPLKLAFPQPPSKRSSPEVSGADAVRTKAANKGPCSQERSAPPSSSHRASTQQLLAATMAALEQQSQLAGAACQLSSAAAAAPTAPRIGMPQFQAAVAAAAAAAVAGVAAATAAAAPAINGLGRPATAQRKRPTAADINRAAAAAVAAFQMSAAAAAAAARHDDDSSSDTSSSCDDDEEGLDAAVWTACRAAGGTPDGAGAAGLNSAERLQSGAKLQGQEGSCSSATSSPPSSPDSPGSQAVLGVFAGSRAPGECDSGRAGMLGMRNPVPQLGCLQQHGEPQSLPLRARKSDRQVGLETVSRIDAIFQQLRSFQGPLAASGCINGAAAGDAAAAQAEAVARDAGGAAHALRVADAAAADYAAAGATAAAAAAAAAGGGGGVHGVVGLDAAQPASAAVNAMGCSVAALCRGLRYDGDITLKEVAMAFQLRDAYDWDEDLEAAAAQQVSGGQLSQTNCLGRHWCHV